MSGKDMEQMMLLKSLPEIDRNHRNIKVVLNTDE